VLDCQKDNILTFNNNFNRECNLLADIENIYNTIGSNFVFYPDPKNHDALYISHIGCLDDPTECCQDGKAYGTDKFYNIEEEKCEIISSQCALKCDGCINFPNVCI